jgi:signal transduction histidine kinase
VDVTLEVRGDERPLSTGVDLSAHRIIQEALTNVGKHARGAATTVRLGWLPDALEVEVRDRGPGPRQPAGEGHGLVGMRERARIHGGSVSAAPAPEGGFRVVAHLPYA